MYNIAVSSNVAKREYQIKKLYYYLLDIIIVTTFGIYSGILAIVTVYSMDISRYVAVKENGLVAQEHIILLIDMSNSNFLHKVFMKINSIISTYDLLYIRVILIFTTVFRDCVAEL